MKKNINDKYIELINRLRDKTEMKEFKWTKQNPSTFYYIQIRELYGNIVYSIQRIGDNLQEYQYLFHVRTANDKDIVSIDTTKQPDFKSILSELYRHIVIIDRDDMFVQIQDIIDDL